MSRSLPLYLFAGLVVALAAFVATDAAAPVSAPSESPTIEARGHGGGGRGIFKRFKERRQNRGGSGSCA